MAMSLSLNIMKSPCAWQRRVQRQIRVTVPKLSVFKFITKGYRYNKEKLKPNIQQTFLALQFLYFCKISCIIPQTNLGISSKFFPRFRALVMCVIHGVSFASRDLQPDRVFFTGIPGHGHNRSRMQK